MPYHRTTYLTAILWLGCCANLFAQGEMGEHPLVPAIRLAQESMQALEAVNDYQAKFTKREWVGQQFVAQQMTMKLREKPFSVYLHFEQPNAGREILYVHGVNQNKLLAREGSGLKSLVGTVSLAVDDATVKAENRHPITDLGMRRMLQLVIDQWEFESKYGEIDVKYYPDARMGNVACEAIESSHPRPRKQFPFHVTRLYIDKRSRFPIRIENYGFPKSPQDTPPLIEEYTFSEIRPNIRLSDADFDQRNPAYGFAR
ncbi:MAG: DUF1571 domain-containing protein [Planctomycetaceae bacterium]|nr:DUF1571 domain-containing protein [Planctomycetaceae bacterium]